jgi:hypothetical protein
MQGGGNVSSPLIEDKPAAVPETTKQAGETRPDKWGWVDRSVWSERMLETLEKGVKGGVWLPD